MQNFRSFGLKTKMFIITGISETGDIFGRGKWPTLKRWPKSKNFTLSTPPKWGFNGQWWYFQVKIMKFLLMWLLRGLQEILLRGLVAKNFTLLTPPKWGVKWPMVMFLDQNSKIFTKRVGKKSSLDGPISTLLNFLPIIKLFWLCPIAKSELLSWYPIFWNILWPIFRWFRQKMRIFY